MTEQSVIQVLLLVVLVWYLGVWWCLVVRDWPGWEHVRRWKKPKRRKRRPKPYKKLKSFEGLTWKPVCAACAAKEEREGEGVPRKPPPKIERERGRRPEIDTSGQFCPAEECVYHGWLDRGNIVSNGHPSGGQWRQLHCVVCGQYFQETLGTIFYGSSVPADDNHPVGCRLVGGCESEEGGADLWCGQGHGAEMVGGSVGALGSGAWVRDARAAFGSGADG